MGMGRAEGVQWVSLALALLLVALSAGSALAQLDSEIDQASRREGARELQLGEPRECFRSEGGEMRVWDNLRAMERSDIMVQGARITLKNRGLMLPKYDDYACISYVEEGEGMVGYLTGYSLGEKVRHVKRGDVIAFPRGIAHWFYNSGNEEMRILAMADTSSGLMPGEMMAFSLVGGRGGREGGRRMRGQAEMGSVLHGFSKSFLAEAWNMDESEVRELLESQRDVGIVRAEREIRMSDFPGMGRRDANAEQEEDRERMSGHHDQQVAENLGDFVYNVRHGTPDVFVEDAGYVTVVNKFKLPILHRVNMGLAHGKLERNAIVAPHWSPTGHRMFHILRGSGCMEMAGSGGRRLMSKEVMEGEVYVIPRFHPVGMKAGQEGMEWVSFYTTNMPYVEAMAGKTSVFHNLPTQVAAAAFNIDEERVRQCKKHGARYAMLLPSREGRERRRHRDEEEVTAVTEGFVAF